MKIGRNIADSLARVPSLSGPVRTVQTALRTHRKRPRETPVKRRAVLPPDWFSADGDLLHVVAVSHEATRSGAPTGLLRLIRQVQSQPGCTARVVLLTGGSLEADFRATAPTESLHPYGGSFDRVAACLAESGRRCVVVCNTIATAGVAVACRAHGIPVVSWIHEKPTVIDEYFGGTPTIRAMVEASNAVVMPTESICREICEHYGVDARKLHGVFYGVDPARPPEQRVGSRADVRRELGIPESAPLVISMGRAELRKGTDLFVQVATSVIRARRRRGDPESALPHFVWIGSRDETCCRWTDHDVRLTGGGCRERIHFVGERADAHRFHEASDVFVLTSREETGPFVAFEAAAHGIPIVYFAGPIGASEVLLPSEATAVEYLDVDAMVGRVNALLDHRAAAPSAAVPIATRISWDRCTRRIFDLIREQAGGPAAHAVAAPTKKVLVVSYGPPPAPGITAVEGGGLRCWGLSRGLKLADPSLEVTLAVPEWHAVPLPERHDGVEIVRWRQDTVAGMVAGRDAVIASYCLGDDSVRIADAIQPGQMLVLDSYVPIHIEVCARRSSDRDGELKAFERDRRHWESVLRRGDRFLCASQQQRLYYLGVLSAIGRINPLTYDDDPTMIVPYGVHHEEPVPRSRPCRDRVGGDDVWKLLWFGGIYPWFDIAGLLESVKILDRVHPTRLVVVGARNPFVRNEDFDRCHGRFEELVRRPDLAPLVHLVDWVPFDERGDWYLDADLTIMANQPGMENAVAWRTRVVDYLWARVPVATNGGDPIGEELIAAGAALRVDAGDPHGCAEALASVLRNPEVRAAMRERCDALRARYLWPVVVRPLVEAIRTSPGHAAMTAGQTIASPMARAG